MSLTQLALPPQLTALEKAEQACFSVQKQIWAYEERRTSLNANLRHLRECLEVERRHLRNARDAQPRDDA